MATSKKTTRSTSTAKKTTKKSPKTTKTTKTPVKKSNIDETKPQKAPKNIFKNRTFMTALIIGLVLVGLYYARGLFVVAFVNGQPVTRYEVIKSLEAQAGQGATDAIISEKLIRMKAQEVGVSVSQEEINDRIALIEEDLATSGQTLDELLELQGVTRQEVEEQTELQLLLRKLLADSIAVSDEEVDAAFEQQAEIMPEDVTEEEFKEQIRTALQEQKLSFEAQSFIQELQNEANIMYWKEY